LVDDMNLVKEVTRTLDDVLSLGGRASAFTRDTHLLGAIPELDSMAVVPSSRRWKSGSASSSRTTARRRTFGTVGSLADFVAVSLPPPRLQRSTARAHGRPSRAVFLDVDGGFLGSRFAIYHPPPLTRERLIVHVHPFAEELNKSARMAALHARALAEAGYACPADGSFWVAATVQGVWRRQLGAMGG
jgi:hypothetical protein